MTEDFLSELREPPRPDFADELKRRLDAIESEEAERRITHPLWFRLRPAFAATLALAAVAAALSVPAVRASAKNLLEIFRVKRFAVVPVDPARIHKLQSQELDLKTLISSQVEMLQAPGEPQEVPDVVTAQSQVGFVVAEPAHLPPDCSLAEIRVNGPGSFKATVDVAKITELAQALEVTDLDVPPALDGATVAVKTFPAAVLRYTRGKDEFRLFQAKSPEVTLPAGLDVQQLGAIGLQLAGMSPEEARLFAAKMDWRTTLLVPVPAAGGDFRDVSVGDVQGLLVTVRPPARPAAEGQPARPRSQSVLFWSKGDRVFALEGPGRGIELLEMASSIG